MELSLKRKIAVVTGASRGIGKAIALAFAQEGAWLALCARNREPLEAVRRECASHNIEAVALSADVTRPEEVRSFVSFVKNRFHHVDILVNNVGAAIRNKAFWDRTEEDWIEGLKLNLVSAVSLCRQVIPLMRKKTGVVSRDLRPQNSKKAPRDISPFYKSGNAFSQGKIINIASNWGIIPQTIAPEYGAAKAGLIYYTRSLAIACAKETIQVNAVAPGPVRTPALEASATEDLSDLSHNPTGQNISFSKSKKVERFLDRVGQEVLLGRVGAPVDVAQLVLYLSSPWANWITGSCFVIDGGTLKSIV